MEQVIHFLFFFFSSMYAAQKWWWWWGPPCSQTTSAPWVGGQSLDDIRDTDVGRVS